MSMVIPPGMWMGRSDEVDPIPFSPTTEGVTIVTDDEQTFEGTWVVWSELSMGYLSGVTGKVLWSQALTRTGSRAQLSVATTG